MALSLLFVRVLRQMRRDYIEKSEMENIVVEENGFVPIVAAGGEGIGHVSEPTLLQVYDQRLTGSNWAPIAG